MRSTRIQRRGTHSCCATTRTSQPAFSSAAMLGSFLFQCMPDHHQKTSTKYSRSEGLGISRTLALCISVMQASSLPKNLAVQPHAPELWLAHKHIAHIYVFVGSSGAHRPRALASDTHTHSQPQLHKLRPAHCQHKHPGGAHIHSAPSSRLDKRAG